MKKIYQRIINSTNGDCMKCCIATLFDKEYEEVPNFIECNEDWYRSLSKFVQENGYLLEGCLFNYKYQKHFLYDESSNCFNQELKENKYAINRTSLRNANGVLKDRKEIMLGIVISPNLYDENKTIRNQKTHMVLIDKKGNIIFDPNPNYKDLIHYPFSELIGYKGIIEIWELKKI